MKILVTGGAGYIGSVIVKRLVNEGYEVIVVDDLSNGHKEAVHPEAAFVKISLASIEDIDKVFKKHKFDAVIHMAAYSVVGESVKTLRNISATT